MCETFQQALTNIRLSCCGGGSLIPVVKRHHHIETLEMLRELHAVGAVDVRRIDNFIYRATAGEISSCQVWLIQVLVSYHMFV